MSVLLKANNLVRVLPATVPVTLVNDISLEIKQGEFVAIMGPSGSGKSSLLYLLGLLDVPTSGTLWLDNVDTSGYDEDALADVRLSKLGFVFQFHFLLAEFSALDNIKLPMTRLAKLSAVEIDARAQQLLSDLGLADHMHKRPDQMSGGQRQRVAIARALANDPVLILADEPTGNLDTASAATVRQILRDLATQKGKTVITVTHDPVFASGTDRRIALVDGKLDPNWQLPGIAVHESTSH
jgi:lipoprotein-releasing system ATP-binding protein